MGMMMLAYEIILKSRNIGYHWQKGAVSPTSHAKC